MYLFFQVKEKWTEQLVAGQQKKTEAIKKETEKMKAIADAERHKEYIIKTSKAFCLYLDSRLVYKELEMCKMEGFIFITNSAQFLISMIIFHYLILIFQFLILHLDNIFEKGLLSNAYKI